MRSEQHASTAILVLINPINSPQSLDDVRCTYNAVMSTTHTHIFSPIGIKFSECTLYSLCNCIELLILIGMQILKFYLHLISLPIIIITTTSNNANDSTRYLTYYPAAFIIVPIAQHLCACILVSFAECTSNANRSGSKVPLTTGAGRHFTSTRLLSALCTYIKHINIIMWETSVSLHQFYASSAVKRTH